MRNLTLASALAAGLMIPLGSTASQAAPMPLTSKVQNAENMTKIVRYGRYCRRWHRECRYRWGGGWRYRRCMARHDC